MTNFRKLPKDNDDSVSGLGRYRMNGVYLEQGQTGGKNRKSERRCGRRQVGTSFGAEGDGLWKYHEEGDWGCWRGDRGEWFNKEPLSSLVYGEGVPSKGLGT